MNTFKIFALTMLVSTVVLMSAWAQSNSQPIELEIEISAGAGFLTSAEFSPSSATLMTAAIDIAGLGGIQIWDTTTGAEIKSFYALPESASYSPDGEWIAYSEYGSIHVIDASTQEEIFTPIELDDGVANTVSFSPDKRFLLAVTERGVRVWEIETGEEISQFDDQAAAALFSPDGANILIISSDIDGIVRIRNAATGDIQLDYVASDFMVTAADYSPDGKHIVLSDFEGAKIWDANSGQMLFNLNLIGGSNIINDVDYSADGRYIVVGCGDGTARIFDSSTGNELYRVTAIGEDRQVNLVQFSPNGEKIVVAGTRLNNLFVEVWDVTSVTQSISSRMGIRVTIVPENFFGGRPGNPEEVFTANSLQVFVDAVPLEWLSSGDLPRYEYSVAPVFTLWDGCDPYSIEGYGLAHIAQYHITVIISIVDLETGEQIATETFESEEQPLTCPETETFAIDVNGHPVDKTYIGTISTSRLKEWVVSTLSDMEGLASLESLQPTPNAVDITSGDVPSCTGQVISSSSSVNMRSGAGTDFAVLTTVSSDSTVSVLAMRGDWYRVRYEDFEGWISSQLLSLNGSDCASLPTE
ncbi:MAG: SH3 domain-containing protein [Anaerolineae bacterium]|nr:SH3 domain-containing protein [Anaerolineae bacterium]